MTSIHRSRHFCFPLFIVVGAAGSLLSLGCPTAAGGGGGGKNEDKRDDWTKVEEAIQGDNGSEGEAEGVAGCPFELVTSLSPPGERSYSTSTGDLDNDGDVDLVVSSRKPGSWRNGGQISLFLNDGSGNFSEPVIILAELPAGDSYHLIGVFDLNGDGSRDVVFESGWLSNSGNATFSVLEEIHGNGFEGAFYPLVVGDFDEDDDLDLIGFSRGARVVALNDGDGSFRKGPEVAIGGAFHAYKPEEVAFDFEGDGDLDYIDKPFSTGGGFYLNNGDATFEESQFVASMPSGGPLVPVDLDGDGDLDLVTAGNGSLGLLINNGDGTFDVGKTIWFINWASDVGWYSGADYSTFAGLGNELSISDCDRDGRVELVFAAEHVPAIRGSRTFTKIMMIPIEVIGSLADTADLFLEESDVYEIAIEESESFEEGFGNSELEVVDVDGDANLDLIVTSLTSEQVFVYSSSLPPVGPS